MRHALFLPLFDELADPGLVARLAAEAESHGWDGVFVWDHISYRSPAEAVADPWITLAAIACTTSSLRLGPMVTPLARRRPVKVAREVASLDVLSGGRVTLGVGLGGDNSGELTKTGEQLDDRVRAAMLDEGLEILTAAWTGEVLHHRGSHYIADGLHLRPTPVQRPGPPVWVAVRYGREAPLRRAARFDGVFPIEIEHPDQLADVVASVQDLRTTKGPYDVAVGGAAGTDPRPYQAAGATWWLTEFSPFEVTADEVRSVLRAGPPR